MLLAAVPAPLHAAASGLGTGLALIAAIGTQNAMLLRQGIRRDAVTRLIAVCTLSDVLLISAGVAGMGALVQAAPQLITAVTWIGAAFLFVYGLLSLKKGLWGPGETMQADAAAPDASRRGAGAEAEAETGSQAAAGAGAAGRRPRLGRHGRAVLTMLALTWLNPHVYLDTLVFLGSAAAAHGASRWPFGFGAMLASLIWFCALGYGARFLAPLFSRPVTWKVLDTAVGVLMIVLGVMLLRG
ncbi:LysE/ArgO family amino acid transporter [Arthrobacter sp. UM1]|uniref:LysE/ArgO family amino acid transporter n=1 Tax=Arthrobacter sp. UM1 TaxID=2766776 RepID=UPI001CF6B2E7|nr:LysE family transporter [Arthrobacter sp. UM1]MCB4209153.1 LysE family transporter [Arthrobacter sp. UM1]